LSTKEMTAVSNSEELIVERERNVVTMTDEDRLLQEADKLNRQRRQEERMPNIATIRTTTGLDSTAGRMKHQRHMDRLDRRGNVVTQRPPNRHVGREADRRHHREGIIPSKDVIDHPRATDANPKTTTDPWILARTGNGDVRHRNFEGCITARPSGVRLYDVDNKRNPTSARATSPGSSMKLSMNL